MEIRVGSATVGIGPHHKLMKRSLGALASQMAPPLTSLKQVHSWFDLFVPSKNILSVSYQLP